jgi:predicted transcriptional regulator
MNYEELIAKVLKGRSVNAAAKEIGIPQPTLSRYVKAERIPDCDIGLLLVEEAGIDPIEGFKTLAEATKNYKIASMKKQQGFVQPDLLFTLGGGVVVAFLSILCQMRCVKHRRTR